MATKKKSLGIAQAAANLRKIKNRAAVIPKAKQKAVKLPSGQTDKAKAAAIIKSKGLSSADVRALQAQFAAGKKTATLKKKKK